MSDRLGMSDTPDLFDVRHLRHNDGLGSERAALAKVAPTLASMRERILRDIQEAGDRGITPDEWCYEHGALINTVRRRFTDLWKDGFIRHHPKLLERDNQAGNPCVVWVAGRDDEQKPRGATITLLQRIEALEAAVAKLEGNG